MIQLKSISLYRGDKCLINDGSFIAHPGWHVGVTGRNGCGKSSLFGLLRGVFHVDQGDCLIPKEWAIAHMAQEIEALDRPAIEFVIDGDRPLRELEQALERAEAENDNNQIAHIHHDLDTINAYTAESKAAKLLNGLGFTQEQFRVPVQDFSGGWRMRLNLAKTLMCRSDLLLLDEPTNHLDLDAILWLEDWLKQYPGTLMLISHDREFLDGIVQHILHVENQTTTHYKGNYSSFEVQRAMHLQQQQSAFEKQQREVAHMQKYIDRFRAQATKARQAQSRLKALDRLERIAPAHIDSPFSFHFETPDNMADPLLSIHNADMGYGENPILNKIKMQLGPDSRIGLLGPNGAGKSTLIKTLVGDIPLIDGELTQSEHCNIGYFAQHQVDQLDPNASPLIQLQRLTPTTSEAVLRKYLGSFNFIGDQVHDPIGRFSGGEKARLALALIIWNKPNLLLLDEPTNHLDLEMRHALTMALQSFEGALLIVSHDRHLIRSVTDSLYLVADGKADEFKGDLEDYASWLAEFRGQQKQSSTQDSSESKVDKKTERQRAAELRKQLSPLKKRVDKAEKAMDKRQIEKDQIEQQLADPDIYDSNNKEQLTLLLKQQGELSSQLETLEMEWMDASEAMEALATSISEQT
ncbi:ABC transporter ATP-binding protein [Gammaproteobacteria bacterium 45_16_T64]|nr:ABC transporter ATP-binding protein [Gammaproteobacteria bacterium 45_16_T64]